MPHDVASIRLGDLIRAPELGLSVIVGDAAVLDQAVSGAYITDLPDPSRFVRSGMVVLTSGLWVEREGGVERFVDALVRVDAAALIVGLVELGHLPDSVIEACRAHGLTLLTISNAVSFGAVVGVVQARLAIGHAGGDLVSRTAAVAVDAELPELLSFAAHQLGCATWVLDERGVVVVASTHPSAERAAAVRDAAALAPADSPVALAGPTESSAWRIDLEGAEQGGLLVAERPLGSLDTDAQQALGIVASAARGELRYEARVRTGRRRNAAALLEAAVDDAVPPGEVSALMRLVELDPQEPATIVLGSIDGSPLSEPAALELLVQLVDIDAGRHIETVWRGRLVVVVGGDLDPESIRARVAATADVVGATLGGRQMRVVISDPTTGMTRLGATLLTTLDRLGDVRGDGPITLASPSTVTGFRTLLRLVGEEQRLAFAQGVLSPLVDYDGKHGAELIRTLRTFLDHGASWQDASRELHVHPNTLRYRIARIEELTRRDLTSMRDRVDMYLALASHDQP